MGFDLYGLNPVNNSNRRKPNIDWDLDHSEEETEEYFKLQNEFNNKVPGSYFRNNVWWWRPLWDCICNICSDILSDKDMTKGEYNEGHIISSKKSKAIAERIYELTKNGFLTKYEKDYKKEMGSMPKEKCSICGGNGTRKGWEGWQNKTEWLKTHLTLNQLDKNLNTPIDKGLINISQHPTFKWANEMKGCNSCHGKGKVKAFDTKYPFDEDNMLEFAKFCEQSGGFKIC